VSDDDSPKNETTDELQKRYDEQIGAELLQLANYRKALEEEFATKNLDDPETAAAAKAHVLESVPDAATQLKWLIRHADSENIRANLSKWVLELAMKAANKDEGDDALTQLLSQLQKKKVTPSPVNDT
jgi:hypothetical protein